MDCESLRTTRSLDSVTREKKPSDLSVLVTFNGCEKSGVTSLIHRLATDQWRDHDHKMHFDMPPTSLRIGDHTNCVLEDISTLGRSYVSLKNCVSRYTMLSVHVISIDSDDALRRVSDFADSWMDLECRYNFMQPTLVVFSKADLSKLSHIYTCSMNIMQKVGAVTLSDEDTLISTFKTPLLCIDASALLGTNISLIRSYIEQLALISTDRIKDCDVSPRYSTDDKLRGTARRLSLSPRDGACELI